MHVMVNRKASLLFVFALLSIVSRAQFIDNTVGLLHCPSAEMNRSGTFMITNNFLNQHALPTRWSYNTFGYGFDITFISRLEIAYGCTIFNYKWAPKGKERDLQINQDRHFAARVQVLKEDEFGAAWIPSVVLGVSDPISGGTGDNWGDYKESDVSGSGNGYFNRYYVAVTKHINTSWGVIGGTVGYQYNRRLDYPLNAPCAAITWNPKWLNVDGCFLSSFRLIAEFDSRTFNMGFTTSIWKDHFEAMFELKNMCWISAGLRYKVVLKGAE